MFKAMGDDHVREVMGSNPGAVYWMDMTFFKFICCKNCIVCLKRPKINANEAGVGPFLEKKPFCYNTWCRVNANCSF